MTTIIPSSDSTAVHQYLTLLQSVISRMAGNSSSCKTWCVTLVAAILVFIADKGKPAYAWIAILPTVSFYALDAYYLALEKWFRDAYADVVRKLHKGDLAATELFVITPPKRGVWQHRGESLISFSVLGFYGFMIAVVAATKWIALDVATSGGR